MKSTRISRISEELHREMAGIIAESDDFRLSNVSVTRVKVSPNLRRAQVFFQLHADTPVVKEVLGVLHRARSYFRHSLAQRMGLRYTPEVEFLEDHGQKNADRVETLLERIRKRRRLSVTELVIFFILFALTEIASAVVITERYRASTTAMGCTYMVVTYGMQRHHLASAVQAAFTEVDRIDSFLSHYKMDSELSRINRLASFEPQKLSKEMFDLLSRCREYSRLSEGGFDITVGPLMSLWGFGTGDERVPSEREIEKTLLRVGYYNLVIDEMEGTVYFSRPGIQLDPGGIGKGYAVDRMVEVLRDAGVEIALVNGCGSSFYGIGAPPGEPRGWRVNIRSPKKSGSNIAHVYLHNESLSISGSYENFFEFQGKRYSHLLDPRSGMAVEGTQAVSVVAPSAVDSEVWGTALLVNGVEWAKSNKPKDFQIHICLEDGFCGWI